MLQSLFGLVYLSAALLLVSVTGTHTQCPIEISPQRAVVRYNSSVSVNCSTDVTHDGIGWEASEGGVPMTRDKSLITWSVSNLREWDIKPFCFITYDIDQCEIFLPVTVYKTPDSVSISTVDHTGRVTEGSMLNLQCDIMNVAPVQYLTVRWYKGETLLHHETFTDTINTPVNISVIHKISPVRADDGAQYRCEAELELGAEGPQPPPTVTSEPLSITVLSTHTQCPIEINPQRAVVRYDSSVSVDCSTDVTHDGIGWEASEGGVPLTRDKSLITWSVSNLREWDIKPQCYIMYDEKQCEGYLPVTVYKTPDSVSISTVDHTGPVTEGSMLKLQCDIMNVAPVQNLIVRLYKGETLLHHEIFNDTIETPVNKSVTHKISPDRADDGAQYRCEAELQLGAEGPQPPTVTSEPLNITVHFPPVINEIKLPSIVPVFRGYPLVLVCEAEGNPKPTISWSTTNKVNVTDGNLTITEATREDGGRYNCTAENSVNTKSRIVQVVIQDVSISTPDHKGPMIEGRKYKLQCEIHNVINESQSLIVRWYKKHGIRYNVTNIIANDTIKTSVNKSVTHTISPVRADDGAQYICEAELQLGAEGPQPPPTVPSEPLSITVHFPPVINEAKLPSIVPVFRGYPLVLVCEAEGNPKPTISWSPNNTVKVTDGNLTVTEATLEGDGIYICTAENSVNTTRREVKVVLKEDYLPLIAGFVAVAVAVISVIFIFIYSIYYKKAKMGHYSLKDAKPCAQNGNIAQNGKDNTIPMKKLSQSNILA